jgi:trehalose synthase
VPVETQPRSLGDFGGVAAAPLLDEARELARSLQGARVLHVNATAYGGGVAELLGSEIPLMADLGVAAEWRVICPDDRLFAVTKRIHNAMQGQRAELSRPTGTSTGGTTSTALGCSTTSGTWSSSTTPSRRR